jgi:predicted nucleic acid-binding protein
VGTIAIPSGTVAYVDANALIYAVEKIAPYADLLRPFWTAAKSGTARLVSSELLIIETLTGPLKSGNRPLVAAYEQIFQSSGIDLSPITADILRSGATLRSTYGLKTPDAIHAATALRAGCSMYLTNDEGFRRVQGIHPIILKDHLIP